MNRKYAATALLTAATALTACSNNPTEIDAAPAAGTAAQIGQVDIRDLFVLGGENGKPLPAGGSAPVYLTMVDKPAQVETQGPGGATEKDGGDELVSVSSPAARSGNVIGGPLKLPAGQDVTVGPSAKIVLTGLTKPLDSGQNIQLTLTFRKAGSGTITVPIQARQDDLQTYSPAP